MRTYQDFQDPKSRKTCVSGEKTAVKLPRGKFLGLLSSSRGICELFVKKKIMSSVEIRIERFASRGRRSGTLLSKNLSLEDFALCKFHLN